MIKLKNIDINEFSKNVYTKYLELFIEAERKSYKKIEKLYYNGLMKLIKITNNDILVGFMIINSLENNKYIQLDYLAILPQYQNKGYGTEAVRLLIEKSKDYYGIFVEVEKLGLGSNKKENAERIRRINFYEHLGFYKLNFELIWFNSLVLSPYIVKTSNYIDEEAKIIDSVFEIYNKAHGEDKVKSNCKLLK